MDKRLLKLARMLMKFTEITINDKTYFIDGDIEVGNEVVDDNGEVIEDGEYIVEGKKLTVKEGKIETVEEVEIEPETEEETEPETIIEQEETEPETVTEQPIEKDEKDLRIEELEGLLRDRDAIIEELNAKIKELEDKQNAPTEDSVAMNKVTGNKEVNGALKYFV